MIEFYNEFILICIVCTVHVKMCVCKCIKTIFFNIIIFKANKSVQINPNCWLTGIQDYWRSIWEVSALSYNIGKLFLKLFG